MSKGGNGVVAGGGQQAPFGGRSQMGSPWSSGAQLGYQPQILRQQQQTGPGKGGRGQPPLSNPWGQRYALPNPWGQPPLPNPGWGQFPPSQQFQGGGFLPAGGPVNQYLPPVPAQVPIGPGPQSTDQLIQQFLGEQRQNQMADGGIVGIYRAGRMVR